MDQVRSAFLEKILSPLERVGRLWTVVFCLRYWRLWLKSDKVYTLAKNFISPNAYLCIETNAHSLVVFIRKFRIKGTPEELLVQLLGSLQCESFFRGIRALCPVGLNKPSVSEGEFLDRARKVDVNLPLRQKESQDGIVYRRVDEKRNRSGGGSSKALGVVEMPSDDEITDKIKSCIPIALKKMETLDILLKGKDLVNFSFSSKYAKTIRNNKIYPDDLETQTKKMSSDRNLEVRQLVSFPDAQKLLVR